MDIKCPGCHGVYHETTEAYDPKAAPNPAMCRLKDKYRAFGWEEFPQDPNGGIGIMECPSCGSPYVQAGGKLPVVRGNKPKSKKKAGK